MNKGFAREPTQVIQSDDLTLKSPSVFNQEEIKGIKQRFNHMFSNKTYQNYKRRWLSIRDKQLPFWGDFLDSADDEKGRKRDQGAVDGEAARSNMILAGGMASGLTPQSIQWFKFGFEDTELNEYHQAKVVLDARLEMISKVLAGSNFYNASHTNYQELAFGQSPIGTFEDPARGVYFETYPIGCYAYEVDSFGVPCSFAVRKKYTAYQIKQKFPRAKLPDQIERDLKENKGFEKEYDVCWLVEKNDKVDKNKLGNQFLPYISMYWINGTSGNENDFLQVGGFHEFPIAIARYQVIGNQAYGIGPGWYADGDVRMLYRMLQEGFTNMELFSRPPLQTAGSMRVNTNPGGVTRNDMDKGKVESLFNTMPIFKDIFEIVNTNQREFINRAYNTNLFAMLGQASMNKSGRTAYEFALRDQEKMQQLGPVVERQNGEYLGPILKRVYNILERAGVLPFFPQEVLEELQGQKIEIEYVSPLAQAAKMSGTQNIEMLLAMAAQTAQLNPDTIHLFDFVEILRSYASKTGTDTKLLVSPEAYQEKMDQLAKAAQAEKEQAMVMAGGQPAQQYTQAAANIQSMASEEDKPALETLLAASGGGF
jgi:hypothetical protein